MPVKPNQLSIESFRNELINRFFHPDSYFMHCFSHHLQAFLDKGGNSNNNEYLLVGNLMDKLVASQNAIEDLESVLALQGFESFNERLSKGIDYLYESDLEPEKMKIEIESLAQSMFSGAVAALQNKESNDEITSLLGINRTPTDNVDELEVQEPSSEGPGLTKPEFSVEEIEDMDATPQNLLEEKDFLLPLDECKEANPGKSEVSLVEEDGSRNFAQDDVILINTEINQKPESVFAGFQTAVGNQIEQLQNKIDLLSSKNGLLECDGIFESIISSSMIYGFDAVEEVAEKARRFLSKVSRQSAFDSNRVTSVLTKTISLLKRTLENGPDNVDKQAISDFSQNLLNQETILPAKKENCATRTQSDEKKDEPGPSRSSSLEEFKLPGEDEIASLLSEISENCPLQKDEGLQPDSPEPSESEVLVMDVPQVVPGDLLSSYKQQAKLYFDVIEQALNLLEGQPGHKTALEDVELACNSLYGLVLKMELDSIAKTPELIAELIRNIIGNRYSLSKNEHGLLKNSLRDFRNISNVIDVERQEFKENIVSLQTLNSKISMSRSSFRKAKSIDRFKMR
ncbi:hypothetical protein IID10_15495 [candidate division KSB1 bacterium]|nr:hypothetical protein [candidate division KSB1 bacterium]TDI93192.1 MAG: hypothetical protein E2O77_03380 [Caldithrix sp.]